MPNQKELKKSKWSLDKKSLAFLSDYISTASPTGAEVAGQKKWLEYIKPYIDKEIVDPYGTVVGVVNPSHTFKVVIEAHSDEISWFVNYIESNGLIYLKRNGGVDPQIAPSMRVNIHGDKGIVKGVIGWPAIHVREKEYQTKLENIWIDCGARNKKEVKELGIAVGSLVTYQDGLEFLPYNYIAGRALDNRIGGFMIAEVLKHLSINKIKLPFSLYIVNSVQEEIGLRGAEMIARRIKPDIAIVTDVTHDTQTPMMSKYINGDISCGEGPTLSYAPAVHNKLIEFVKDVGKKSKIPMQFITASRSTGTDTDSFAYANDGCPSVLISLPLRYMHTTVEMVYQKDIEDVIALIYETLCAITPKINLKYF